MTDEHTQQAQRTHPTPADTTPRVIAGRYVIVDEIGHGGMGTVWRAADQVIGRHVAIKELRLPEGSDEAGVFQERVLREVRSGGKLNDPAVVTVYDVITEGAATFIVMELVEAPTLSELVRARGPLPARQVAAIGEQVLSALHAAHQAGIVHRDVKPGNVMVSANGRVKLTDFGIAQAVDDPRLTTSGNLVGSPAFMAPERIDGHQALAASDLWSLGATLFFAVEGLVAFERQTTAATLHAIMNEVPYLTHAQGPLASAIMGLLIASPGARISAEQARGLLSMASANDGERTPPGGQHTAMYPGGPPTAVTGQPMVGPQYSARPASTTKRAAWVVGGAVLGVALLVGGVFLGRWWATPEVDKAMQPTLTYGPGNTDIAFDFSGTYRCFTGSLQPGYQIPSDNSVSCSKPHDFEVYDDGLAYGGSSSTSSSSQDSVSVDYPDNRLREWAEARCAMSFHSNLVPPERRGELSYRALIPSQDAWETGSSSSSSSSSNSKEGRTAVCALTKRAGGQLTGPVAKISD